MSAGRQPKVVGQAGAYHLTHTPLGRVDELDGCVVVLQDQLVELQTAIGMTLEYLLSVTGACDAAAQSPWRVARSPDRLSLYG
jgi:hypothetical protein